MIQNDQNWKWLMVEYFVIENSNGEVQIGSAPRCGPSSLWFGDWLAAAWPSCSASLAHLLQWSQSHHWDHRHLSRTNMTIFASRWIPLPSGLLCRGVISWGLNVSRICFSWRPDLLLPEKLVHLRLQGLEIKYFLCYPFGMMKPWFSIVWKLRISVMLHSKSII